MSKTLFHNPDIKQINYLDNRYYKVEGKNEYYPSVTTLLEVFPKGHGFDIWLKQVGNNAQEIMEKAGEQGSKIHSATDNLHEGIELKWANEEGKANYTLKEWQMILKYKEFWDKIKPELIACEYNMCSPKLGFGGTLDRVVMIGGVRWLLDIKSSNYLHKTHELQLSAYAMLFNELNPDTPIEQTGILWLNAATRTEKIDIEKHIYQGMGWQIKTFNRHYTDAFKIFEHAQAIWKEENPSYKPLNLIYPDFIKL